MTVVILLYRIMTGGHYLRGGGGGSTYFVTPVPCEMMSNKNKKIYASQFFQSNSAKRHVHVFEY